MQQVSKLYNILLLSVTTFGGVLFFAWTLTFYITYDLERKATGQNLNQFFHRDFWYAYNPYYCIY